MTTATNDPLTVPAPDLELTALGASLAASWGIEGELVPLHGERDRNFRVTATDAQFLLKVHNPADGETVLDLQRSAMEHIRAVAPELPVPVVVPTLDGRPWLPLTGRDGRPSLAWVMTWLEGRHPRPEELGPEELRDWGRTSARLGRALRGFVHPAGSYPIAWDIRRLSQLRPWLDAVAPDRRAAVESVLDRFDQRVTPALRSLRAQVVHNDLAPANVLVGEGMSVTGITDFGDMTHTALVCDLAVAAADLLAGRDDVAVVLHHVVAGYDDLTPIEPEERALLPDLVAGRYAASVLITAWRTRKQGWAPEIDEEAYRALEAVLRTSPPTRRSTTDLQRARSRTLGALELSYSRPLHLVSGRGVFLEAADGRRYLDAYNNVPVLGHSHPAVTSAVSAQLARLNTNSRYLQDAPVELAERLLASLPDRFDRVLLVNSGSEANDLAWRIARHATGASSGIATRWAYHGVTEATFAFSPESWGRGTAPGHIRLVEPGSAPSVAAALADLRSGPGVAAMLVDGVLTSDGILGPAHEWTRAAAAAVHEAGGLYVADEVQAGHGRTGAHLWSFVAGEVPADLVTLGKPMGNGYPVAAVVGPARLVDPFVEATDYFSTFGGGTAACAAALAVLRTIEEERLVDRVAEVGGQLRAALADVASGHPELNEVRGWGLAIGVDVVDPGTGRPDPERAAAIVERMRDRGVLVGRTAPTGATLKVRPPLVLGAEHVPLLTEALAAAVATR